MREGTRYEMYFELQIINSYDKLINNNSRDTILADIPKKIDFFLQSPVGQTCLSDTNILTSFWRHVATLICRRHDTGILDDDSSTMDRYDRKRTWSPAEGPGTCIHYQLRRYYWLAC